LINEDDPDNNFGKTTPNQVYLLPQATPLLGREGKSVCTLVLDIGETLLRYQ
jgi:hypothetical protein